MKGSAKSREGLSKNLTEARRVGWNWWGKKWKEPRGRPADTETSEKRPGDKKCLAEAIKKTREGKLFCWGTVQSDD